MRNIYLVLASVFVIFGCSPVEDTAPKPATLSPAVDIAFVQSVRQLCGQAFAGAIVSQDAVDADWRAERLVMHVRDCSDGEVKIALHVGDNRSRTWILRPENGVLALRHDHRHEDGMPDALTYYGGRAGLITETMVEFPADASTKTLFDKEGIPVSKTNIWSMEIDMDAGAFTYTMRRPERFFEAQFDLTTPLEDLPPTPWGW